MTIAGGLHSLWRAAQRIPGPIFGQVVGLLIVAPTWAQTPAPASTTGDSALLANPTSLITANDYPRFSIFHGEEGVVIARFTVEAADDGTAAITECRIDQSSGSRRLDYATCRLIVDRGRAKAPADPKLGKGPWVRRQSVLWRLPISGSRPLLTDVTVVGQEQEPDPAASATGAVVHTHDRPHVRCRYSDGNVWFVAPGTACLTKPVSAYAGSVARWNADHHATDALTIANMLLSYGYAGSRQWRLKAADGGEWVAAMWLCHEAAHTSDAGEPADPALALAQCLHAVDLGQGYERDAAMIAALDVAKTVPQAVTPALRERLTALQPLPPPWLSIGPVLQTPPEVVIRPEDQPDAADVIDGHHATRVAVLVGTDGIAHRCFVRLSSLSFDLDQRACTRVMTAARFAPAQAIDGQPVAAWATLPISWRVPHPAVAQPASASPMVASLLLGSQLTSPLPEDRSE